MAYMQGNYQVHSKTEIAPGVFDFWVVCPDIAKEAEMGQFVHIRVDGFTLRRPISICRIDREAGMIRLVMEVRGEGTHALAKRGAGETMDLIGPLGKGFSALAPDQKVIVVGGGIGVPPLLEVASFYGKHATALLGFRGQSAVILEHDFQRAGADTRIATDDGSYGHHGLVTDLLKRRLEEGPANLVCACGPMVMLKAVVSTAQQYGVKTEVSLEERMGCGVGACLVCACKTVKDGREIHSHVCKDGPVFDGETVSFT